MCNWVLLQWPEEWIQDDFFLASAKPNRIEWYSKHFTPQRYCNERFPIFWPQKTLNMLYTFGETEVWFACWIDFYFWPLFMSIVVSVTFCLKKHEFAYQIAEQLVQHFCNRLLKLKLWSSLTGMVCHRHELWAVPRVKEMSTFVLLRSITRLQHLIILRCGLWKCWNEVTPLELNYNCANIGWRDDDEMMEKNGSDDDGNGSSSSSTTNRIGA